MAASTTVTSLDRDDNGATLVTKEMVCKVVELYGVAWTTQNTKLLNKIFTKDAIYIERAFDKNATFRTLPKIKDYWNYQICGKQSQINFLHLTEELVLDKNVAVVKWLAEFDNRRENRGNQEHKRVRFCQMAKLRFRGDKIEYLEEYSQDMTGSGVRWPGLDKDANHRDTRGNNYYESRIKMDPPPPPKPIACDRCQQLFTSRTKLFEHLKSTIAWDDESSPGCIPKPSQEETESVWVCLSLGYWGCNNPEQRLRLALIQLILQSNGKSGLSNAGEDVILERFEWNIPPSWMTSAIINIAFLKLAKKHLPSPDATTKALDDSWTQELNENLRILSLDTDGGIRIHTAGIVERPCTPEKREYETYEAFVPWKWLSPSSEDTDDIDTLSVFPDNHNHHHLQKQEQHVDDDAKNNMKRWRTSVSDTSSGKFVTPMIAKHVKQCARLFVCRKDLEHFSGTSLEERKIKIRTSTVTIQPYQEYCRITLCLRQPVNVTNNELAVFKCVGQIVGHLVRWIRNSTPTSSTFTSEEEQQTMVKAVYAEIFKHPTSTTPKESTVFPSRFLCLREPALARYESKTGLILLDHANKPQKSSKDKSKRNQQEKTMKTSISQVEQAILGYAHAHQAELKEWMRASSTDS